jgi:hypothetical protein
MQTNKIELFDNRTQSSLKKQLLDFSSRYNHIKLMSYSDFKILTFETYERLVNENDPDLASKIKARDILFYSIELQNQYKPWLVSQKAYNDPGYWWFIMEFNNIFDVEEFTAGKTIKIPPLYSISTRTD